MNKKAVNNYKVVDLRSLGIMTESDPAGQDYIICSHCAISMTRVKNGYFCKECGLVKGNDGGDSAATTLKSREKIGPKIPQRNSVNNGFIFKNIKFTQTHPAYRPRSKLQQFFNAEDEREENLLKAGGCLIGDEQNNYYYDRRPPLPYHHL